MATRTFADLSSYRRNLDNAQGTANVLDSLIQGLQGGIQLQQLPQQIQNQQLAQQLQNALVTQKIQDLQNPNEALARELQKFSIEKGILNPGLGVQATPPGLTGETISTPQAIPQTAKSLNDLLAANPSAAIPSAAPTLPITPIGIGNVQTGLSVDQNVPAQAAQDKFDKQIQMEKLIHPDKTSAATLYNTAPGHKIVDAQGNVIFENPANSPNSKSTVVHPGDTVLDENNNPIFTAPNASGASQQDLQGDIQDILEGRNSVASIKTNVGRSKEGTAYLNAIRSGIRAKDPTFDFAASDAGVKSVSSNYVQKATGAINAVLPNIDKIIDLSNQVPRLGIAGVDNLLQKGQVQIGNTKVANLRQAQKLIADEIGVALGAGNVSDMKLQLGFDVTDPSVSPEVFSSNMGLVKEFLNNRKQGLDSLRYHSSTVTPANNTDQKSEALKWLLDNPTDKDAPAVRKKLGL